MSDIEGELSWRDIVRENNEPGSPNILLMLEDAAKSVQENPDKYDKALVFLYRNQPEVDLIVSSWFNAGMRFSEIVFLLDYLKDEFITEMKRPVDDEE